jgi:hypothetical protein
VEEEVRIVSGRTRVLAICLSILGLFLRPMRVNGPKVSERVPTSPQRRGSLGWPTLYFDLFGRRSRWKSGGQHWRREGQLRRLPFCVGRRSGILEGLRQPANVGGRCGLSGKPFSRPCSISTSCRLRDWPGGQRTNTRTRWELGAGTHLQTCQLSEPSRRSRCSTCP